ncbi:MAG: Transcriptional regulator, TetR [Marmoricola sp.]|nr:Transcriptional regulator, TetR [Marmoricola sp.]
MTELVRPWRGVSAEDRRTERRARLLEACLDVIGTDGVAATTVDRVCAEARLTKRYFYESFADLDALLLATADDLFESLRDQMGVVTLESRDSSERTHAVVTVLIDVLSGDSRRARLYVESPGHPALRLRREQAVASFTDFVASQVLPPAEPPTSEQHRLLATRLLVAGTTDLVTSWLAGDIEADRTSIIATIERIGRSV